MFPFIFRDDSVWNKSLWQSYLLIFQLIIATIPDSEHGKPPSIITEDNIELLFEIQEKVFYFSFFWLAILWMAVLQCSGTFYIKNFLFIDLTGWWNSCKLFGLIRIFEWHLLEAFRWWLCHPKHFAGLNPHFPKDLWIIIEFCIACIYYACAVQAANFLVYFHFNLLFFWEHRNGFIWFPFLS